MPGRCCPSQDQHCTLKQEKESSICTVVVMTRLESHGFQLWQEHPHSPGPARQASGP
jgi:hypothetical protein